MNGQALVAYASKHGSTAEIAEVIGETLRERGFVTDVRPAKEVRRIDEYRLVVHPVLAGHGPRLFDGLAEPRQLERVSVKTFKGGQTAMHFRRRTG